MASRKLLVDKKVSMATVRLSAMQQIDTDKKRVIDYGDTGNPLTSVEVENQIDDCETKRTGHNQLLEQVDSKKNDYQAAVRKLSSMYTQVLKGAVSKFGPDANEVEQLGGTRSSDRKRPARKPKTQAA